MGDSGKGLGAIAVSRVFRGNAAAQLHAAPPVGVIQHRLADAFSLQTDGEIHAAAQTEILPGRFQKIVLQGGAVVVLMPVVAPKTVARVIQAEGIIGRLILFLQGIQGQPVRVQGGDLPNTV